MVEILSKTFFFKSFVKLLQKVVFKEWSFTKNIYLHKQRPFVITNKDEKFQVCHMKNMQDLLIFLHLNFFVEYKYIFLLYCCIIKCLLCISLEIK